MALFAWLRSDPRKRLEKELRDKSARAMELQRAGKLRESASLQIEVKAIESKLDELASTQAD